ncbi:DUF1444 domain-containing protein [Virgibacillus halophilus]|uniref:DUF1444 domain-containing protein n=1 Tax=Tigheibacillus halophilus TaxID=361280 RepID=UPI003644729F
MKMTSIKMKRLLEEKLSEPGFKTSFNREKDTFRIEWKENGEGVTITLPNVIAKYEENGEGAIDELIDHIKESMRIMQQQFRLSGNEKNIYPVIRATSFPLQTKAGKKLVWKDHTAETRIFYAIDSGKSYRLIDNDMLKRDNWTLDHVAEVANFNLRALSTETKADTVADNDFYFVSQQDGYDASRILNTAFLSEMNAKAKGELVIAAPHQDVLILADIRNKTGYDILAQMAMKFFAEGRVPITSLSFVYEKEKLTPIFILAKNRPENN